MDDRPVPGWPGYRMDRAGRVRRLVLAHGRNYPCLVVPQDGVLTLRDIALGTRTVQESTLFAQVWPELVPAPPEEADPQEDAPTQPDPPVEPAPEAPSKRKGRKRGQG